MLYKRLIAGWAALALLISFFSLTPQAHAEEIELFEFSQPAYLSAAPTSSTAQSILENKELEEYLEKQLVLFPESIDLSSFRIPATTENVSAVIRVIQFQLPELIHMTPYYQYNKTSGYPQYLYELYPRYNSNYNATTLKDNLARCQKAAANLIADLDGCSELEKALLLHDRIALLNTYNHAAVNDSQGQPEAFNMAGVFLNGEAVCQGIAVSYHYLLDLLGMENRICASDSLNHAWNIVTVDGAEYHVDITWDDPTLNSSKRDIAGYVKHTNFLRSTAGIRATGHNAYDFDTSPTSTTYDNHFWQSINTSFQRAGEELYYIDQTEAAIMRFRDRAEVLDLSGEIWQLSNGAAYVGNFSYLAGDGVYLLYSGSRAIYRFDPETQNTETVYQPQLTGDYMIFGLELQNDTIYCELHDEPYPLYATENILQASTRYTAVGLNDLVRLLRYLIGKNQSDDMSFFDQNGDHILSITDAVLLLNRLAS